MPDEASEARAVALDKLRRYSESLRAERKALDQKLHVADVAIQMITRGQIPDLQQFDLRPWTKYSSMPAQQAVERFLRDHPQTAFKASEVAHGLIKAGFPATARNFSSQVGVTLNRLMKKGTVERDRDANIWVYQLKEAHLEEERT